MLGGIEAGGTKCVVAVADDDLSIIAEATIPTTAPDETFASIINFFEQAQSEHGSDLRHPSWHGAAFHISAAFRTSACLSLSIQT